MSFNYNISTVAASRMERVLRDGGGVCARVGVSRVAGLKTIGVQVHDLLTTLRGS